MIPHRAKVALAAAACCALASCLDARVNVPVSVRPIARNQSAEAMKRIDLWVYKAAPMIDENHPQYARCTGDAVETQKTDMEGRAAFSLLPGDYEVCTEEQLYDDEKFKWGVPFKVADEGFRVPQLIEDVVTYVGCGRAEQNLRLLRWTYAGGGGGRANELLLTRDNATDRTHTPQPQPTPMPCSSPTPVPSPSASPSAPPTPTAGASPTTQASPTTSPAPAVSPTPTPNPQPAPARVPPPGARRGVRRRRA
jgi:cell division septation protein DedD